MNTSGRFALLMAARFIGGDGGLLLRVEHPKKPRRQTQRRPRQAAEARRSPLRVRPLEVSAHAIRRLHRREAAQGDRAERLQARVGRKAAGRARDAHERVRTSRSESCTSGATTTAGYPTRRRRRTSSAPRHTRLEERPRHGLFEAFGGLHFIGYQGNGDYYLIETTPKVKGANQIVDLRSRDV